MEYKVVTININPGFFRPRINDSLIESKINVLAKDGWIIDSVVPNAGFFGHLYSYTIYLKREK